MEVSNQKKGNIQNLINDLAQQSKSSGHVSTGEILEAMGEMDFDPDD